MDFGQYLDVFVAECRELLESLNLSIVELERSAGDSTAVIDEIFRVAHSLKGVSSTMGFDRMAGLTHEMEHLLDIVRAGGMSVDQDLVTLLLGCLDLIETAVDGIEAGGEEGIDPSELIAKLQAMSHGTGDAHQASDAAPASASLDMPDPATLPDGIELIHVHVEVDPSCESTSIRAYMAYSAIETIAEAMWSRPSPEELDEWEQPTVDVLIARESDEIADSLREALGRIPELSVVDLLPYSAADTGAAAVPAAPAPVASAPAPAPVALVAEPAAVPAPAASTDAPSPAAAAAPSAGGSAVKQRKSGTIRVDAARLDALMHLMGEVVVHRSSLEALLRDRDVDAALEMAQELRRSTQALQAEVMNVRMVPVESAFMRMPRLVRDLSTKLGKDVELVITGADTEIDRSVVDALGDPLVHLVRNALDHGIEGPQDREAAGKSATAQLHIGAEHAGGNVVISVGDDGRGIDTDRVKARAIDRGIITAEAAALLDEQGAIELLFAPGFSTAEVATDVSGRGVGMDAVRAMCREWGGDVEFTSTRGQGSVARIRIPLTLAVMTVLVVKAGVSNVAIPIDRIERTIRLADHPRVALAGTGQRMIRLDDGVLAEVDLGDSVGYGADDEPTFGVIVHGAGGRKVVLAVKGLVGEHEAVTKPLPKMLGDEAAFMGAAVQGDGAVVLIVDCDALVEGDRGGAAPHVAAPGTDNDGKVEAYA